MKNKFIFIITMVICLFIVGCGKSDGEEILEKFINKTNKSNQYYLTGELEMVNNEDVYTYSIETSYQEDDKFLVNLINKTNEHQQIILKNEDGVYVLTPSLNKSFKFQSDWPYNNSQIYLLQTIVLDIENDNDKIIETTDNGIVVTTKTNYSNNKNLVTQKIYINKEGDLTQIDVLNTNELVEMKMVIENIDYNKEYNDDYFKLDENMQASDIYDENSSVSIIDDVVFPLNIPLNTELSSQTTVEIDDGQRIILTFEGDSPFVLIEETVMFSETQVTLPVSGEMVLFPESIAVVSENGINWYSDGIEYNLISASLELEEMVEIAKSVSVLPISK